MNKKIKVVLIIFLILLILSVETYAKYNYTYSLKAYSLTRDSSEIVYNITRTENDKTYTNKDVLLTINLNKPIDNIDGFALSEDKKTLTKVLKENEEKTITVEDISGNSQNITYNINNIDKIPPEIQGVNDGGTYKVGQKINYMDNVGIKDIFVDKYSSLKLLIYDDYYDDSKFKGIDISDKTINIRVISHPKNTVSYAYYLNGVLKGKTKESQYKFTGLNKGTQYTIKVEALDANGKILQSATRSAKTKLFSKIEGQKNSNTFTVKISGIDSSIDRAYGVGFTNADNKKTINATINSDRTVTIKFSALDITGSLQKGYYYFHVHLVDEQTNTIVEYGCCNIMFNTNQTQIDNTIDPYNLTQEGNYQIIVTDLAGNKAEKNITIKK